MRTVPRLTLTLTPTLTPTVTLTVNLSSVVTMNTGALGWAGPHAPQHPRIPYRQGVHMPLNAPLSLSMTPMVQYLLVFDQVPPTLLNLHAYPNPNPNPSSLLWS